MIDNVKNDRDRPSLYVYGGKLVVRASAFGSCYKALVAESLGYIKEPILDLMLTAFAEGREREPIILDRLVKEFRIKIQQPQKTLSKEFIDGVLVSGSIDGLGWRDGKLYLIEVKTASATSFEKYKKYQLTKSSIDTYPWQVSVYFHMLKEIYPELHGILYAVQLKGKDPQTDEIYLFEMQPPNSINDIESRSLIIQGYYKLAKSTGELPPCDSVNNFCPFRYLHADAREEIVDPDIARFVELYERAAALEADLKETKELIVGRYKDDPRSQIGWKAHGYTFKISTIESSGLDTKKVSEFIKESGKNLEEFTKASTSYLRLTTTKQKN